jgi:hypothetical protein
MSDVYLVQLRFEHLFVNTILGVYDSADKAIQRARNGLHHIPESITDEEIKSLLSIGFEDYKIVCVGPYIISRRIVY